VAVVRAIQYVYSVDNPSEVPDEARELIRELDRELRRIHRDRDIKLPEAEARVNAVIARFRTLPDLIKEDRDERATPGDEPEAAPAGATPAPPPSTPQDGQPAPTGTPMPTEIPVPSATPTGTPTP
jgi:hypothetical protein